MDGIFWLNVLSRWVHVTAAVLGVGGLLFVGWALLPAGTEGSSVAPGVLQRFKRLFHAAMGLLLLSGIYNLTVVIPKANALAAAKPMYHSLLGTKILLALVLLGVMTDWLSRGARDPSHGRSTPAALTIGIVLALLVLLLSATVRRLWDLDPRLKSPVVGTTTGAHHHQGTKVYYV